MLSLFRSKARLVEERLKRYLQVPETYYNQLTIGCYEQGGLNRIC